MQVVLRLKIRPQIGPHQNPVPRATAIPLSVADIPSRKVNLSIPRSTVRPMSEYSQVPHLCNPILSRTSRNCDLQTARLLVQRRLEPNRLCSLSPSALHPAIPVPRRGRRQSNAPHSTIHLWHSRNSPKLPKRHLSPCPAGSRSPFLPIWN